jgi:hypothetical protein
MAYLVERHADEHMKMASTNYHQVALLKPSETGVELRWLGHRKHVFLSTSLAQRIVMLTKTKAMSVVCQPQLLIRFGIIFVWIDLFDSAITL